MKHDKKPDKKGLKHITKLTAGKIAAGKIAAGTAASVAVLAGGVHAYKGYQNGSLFRPESFVSNHDYQENQIMFPEKNDYGQTPQTDTSDDNRKLERDPQAEDSYGKDKQDEPEYKTSENGSLETDLKNASNLLIASGTSDIPSDENLPQRFESSTSVIAGTSNSADQSVIQLPSGKSGGISSGTGISLRDDSDSDSGSSDRSHGGNGGNSGNNGNSGGGGGGGASDGGTTPSPTPDPSPAPDPPPTPTPDPVVPTPEPTPVVDPDYPNEGDKPSPPKDFPDLDISAFPSDGITLDDSTTASLTFIPVGTGYFFDDEPGEILYNGAILTDLKLLCAMYAYVDVTDQNGKYVNRYRLTEYNDNFRVGEFPPVINGDFSVTFYFRPNADSEWQEYTQDFTVQYAKVVLLDNDGSTLKTYFVPKEGDQVCLLDPMEVYANNHTDEWSNSDHLDSLFLGWSLTPDGEPLGNWFTPTEPGRYVLYPSDRVSVPDGLTVSASTGWNPYHNYCYLTYLQKLTSAPEGLDVLEVPEGIHEIGSDDFSSIYDGSNAINEIGTLILPNTAFLLYPKYYSVRDAYQVRDDNPYFTVKNGVLYNKDGTQILGIPESRFDSLFVPENVTSIDIPVLNNITKIIFSSDVPPTIDLSSLSGNGTELVVPRKYYANYFVAWNMDLFYYPDLKLTADDGESPEYTSVDDGLYSGNGTVLEYVSTDHSGVFTALDSLETVKENATSGCNKIKQILFGENVKKLEANSLTAPNLTAVFLSAATPPDIDANTFGDLDEALARGLHVIVPEESLSLYQDAWKEVLGDAAMQLLRGAKSGVVETASGLKYETTNQRTVLLHAPADITSFDDIEKETEGTLLWTEIGSNAFSDCTNLDVLDIPDTVTKIDEHAFSGCEGLQLVLIEATAPVTVGADAFDSDGVLQLAAFNSMETTFEDEDLLSNVSCFVPDGSTVNGSYVSAYIEEYDKNVSVWGTVYTLKPGETGTFAYGTDSSQGASYLIGATKDVSGAIEPPDDFKLTQVAPYALADCPGTLTISDEVGEAFMYIGPYAFSNSGLSGDLNLGYMLFDIEDFAFSGCADLHDVILRSTYYQFSLGNYAFFNSSLERITLPQALVSLGNSPFSYCANLKEVIFTGSEPPTLTSFAPGFDYSFGWDDWATDMPANVKTTLTEWATEERYLEKWKYNLKGYSSEEEMIDDKSFPYYYMFDWEDAAGSSPMTEDYEFIPEFLEYVDARANAEAASTLNEAIRKFYWYLGEDVPDGMIQEVVFPDIMEYVKKAEASKASDSNASKATDSDASKATGSDASKTTDSDASNISDFSVQAFGFPAMSGRNSKKAVFSRDLIADGTSLLNSVHFVSHTMNAPQEEH